MDDEKKSGKQELRERFIEMRAAGRSFASIAEELEVSKTTLISWSKGLVIEIQNARSLRLDELYQRFIVAKERRIEAFGSRLEAILIELDKRDLAEIETEKLLALALKYGECLRADYEPLMLAEKGKGLDLSFLDEHTNTWKA
jgi:DNA-binding XRE family transcriptional regulator